MPSVHDEKGNEVSAKMSTIPRAVYRRFGEVQYISVPASSKPVVDLTGYASGHFTLDIEQVAGAGLFQKPGS